MEREFRHNHQTPPGEVRLERKGNVVHIDKPEGTYTIIYGFHLIPQNPNDLPEKLDGLVLEFIGSWSKNPIDYLSKAKNSIQYSPLFKELESNKIPVILADVYFTINHLVVVFSEAALFGVEAAVGLDLLRKLTKEVMTKRMSRRDLLKAGAGAWLIKPLAAGIGSSFSILTGIGREPTAAFQKFSHKIHPESFLLLAKLSEAIFAHKEQWLMEQMGNQPHLASVIGEFHTGIEDWIQTESQERFRYLKNLRPLIKEVVDPETFYKIVKFNFNGGVWQVGETFEVPELKELVT